MEAAPVAQAASRSRTCEAINHRLGTEETTLAMVHSGGLLMNDEHMPEATNA